MFQKLVKGWKAPTNQQGFSLIELMVVVAIIGILASVAVPQYSKFQNKAKQAEARVSLGSVFTIEKTYFVEKNSYSTCLSSIGGSASTGQSRYTFGFSVAGTWDNGSGAATACAAGNGITYFNASLGATALTANTMTAAAATFLSEAAATLASADRWTMNQDGALINTTNGI